MAKKKLKRNKPGRVQPPFPAEEVTSDPSDVGWRVRNWQVLLGLTILIVLCYGHTLNAPWYLDDHHAILDNERIRYFGKALKAFFNPRGPAFLSFALNYNLHEYQRPGYHVANILIHVLASGVAYLLALRLVGKTWMAILIALTFALHPLQTQAVTYIVQRMASLATLFFLSSCYFFCLFRQAADSGRLKKAWGLYGGTLVFGGFAILTKENTAVLPLVLLLIDRLLLPDGSNWKVGLKRLAPFFILAAIFALKAVVLPLFFGGSDMADVAAFHGDKISPWQYLFTEFSVVWLYVRLLLVPYPQKLEYGYWISADLLTPYSIAGGLGLLALLACAWFGRRRLPLVSAGILWFLLGLAVESTLIPLQPVFEHRLYLPMFGFGLFLAGLFQSVKQYSRMVALLVCLTLIWGGLTWYRNNQWNDTFTFYLRNLEDAPNALPVHLKLARIYKKKRQPEKALDHFIAAYRIRPERSTVLRNIVLLSIQTQNLAQAKKYGELAIGQPGSWPGIYFNLGLIAFDEGLYAKALKYFQKTVQERDRFAKAWYMLGRVGGKVGNLDLVEQARRKLQQLDRALLRQLQMDLS